MTQRAAPARMQQAFSMKVLEHDSAFIALLCDVLQLRCTLCGMGPGFLLTPQRNEV